MIKPEIIKASKSKNVKVIPKPSPEMAFESFKMLMEAHHNYKMTVQTETTKREAIKAYKDIKVAKHEKEANFLKDYLNHTFQERKYHIDSMFERLDQGIESGNMELVNMAMQSITAVVKSSPLQEADKVIAAMNDSNVEKIEF